MAHRFHEYLLPLRTPPGFPEFRHMQQSARVAPLMSEGQVTGIIAFITDVTDRVARERDLRAAMEQAQSANIAKSDFIAAMSHELRTPLSAIIGYTDILQAEIAGPLLEAQQKHMNRVKMGAWHLLGIIEEILTFSRAEAGREEVHSEEVDATKLARESVALVDPQAIEKGLAIRLDLGDVPVLMTDPVKVRQILVNLLGNAVKFTDQGEVQVRTFSDADAAYFVVRDTGPGIPSEYLERIFEPFTQVDYSLTRVKGGTGLGLAVSRRLALLLGGDLTVESTLGEGSTFTLRLPRPPAD
jgi:signal transduction histidine kinase